MRAVYGLYRSPESAQNAVEGLRKAGLSDRQITIISSEPLEHYEFAHRESKTWMNWIAVAGAAIGCVGAYLLTSITQKLWPINTGGMPIVTNWSNLIIIFELTMLGAIFATVITLLVTAGIPSFKKDKLYDPEVSDGKILVGVANPSDAAAIERALKAAGRGTLKTLG
jgi:hypothetical protein